MALIKCPECGEQVSSTATRCVHCGCTYTVCPECGKVHVGEFAVCPECGFQIKTQNTFNAVKTTKSNNGSSYGTNVIDAWQSRSSTDKIVMKSIKIANRVFYILFVILLAIALIVIETWDDSSLEALFKVKTIYDNSHALIIAGCVVYALSPLVSEAGFLYSSVMCGAWMRKNQIDATPYIKKASGQVELDFLPQEWNYDNFTSAAYLSVVPHDKNIKFVKVALMVVCLAAMATSGGIFFIKLADELIKLKINSNYEFVFHYEALICLVVFTAVYYTVKIVIDNIFNKRKNNWLQTL
ncbi:MAG: zinc ribbon domain-containing protein [Clostridia bacterium]|nr:zinc ribbon domain-containing protein [Clostridia bacterium]